MQTACETKPFTVTIERYVATALLKCAATRNVHHMLAAIEIDVKNRTLYIRSTDGYRAARFATAIDQDDCHFLLTPAAFKTRLEKRGTRRYALDLEAIRPQETVAGNLPPIDSCIPNISMADRDLRMMISENGYVYTWAEQGLKWGMNISCLSDWAAIARSGRMELRFFADARPSAVHNNQLSCKITDNDYSLWLLQLPFCIE